VDAEGPLDAGRVASWLASMDAALNGDAESDVPCDGCTACCRSSTFVPVLPDDAGALAAIPADLLFPLPGRPEVRVMGYDDDGHCPMLVDDRCSIYAQRPRACRVYDCRAFAATGVEPDVDSQPAVAARVRRWRFDVVDDADRAAVAALQAAGRWIAGHEAELSAEVAPTTAVHRAMLAFELHPAFLPGPDGPTVAALLTALEARFAAR
jgi:hypothetical protein